MRQSMICRLTSLYSRYRKLDGPPGVARLRAEGAQREEVAFLHLHPVAVEVIDGLALEHQQAVFHDVGLGERNGRAGFEGDDVDVHVVPEVLRVEHACRAPFAVGPRHG